MHAFLLFGPLSFELLVCLIHRTVYLRRYTVRYTDGFALWQTCVERCGCTRIGENKCHVLHHKYGLEKLLPCFARYLNRSKAEPFLG